MSEQQIVTTPDSHSYCMACGEQATFLKPCNLNFFDQGEGRVFATFTAEQHLQGYQGLLHGGVIATLLDSAMTNCLFSLGIEALTAELNVRYSKPVAIGSELRVSASLVSQRRKIYQLEARLESDGELFAKSTGKFMQR